MNSDTSKCLFCDGHGKTVLYGQDYHLERPCGFCGGSGIDETGKLARIHADIQKLPKKDKQKEGDK